MAAGSASRHRVQAAAATPCSAVARQASSAAAVTPGNEQVQTTQAAQPGGPVPSWLCRAEQSLACLPELEACAGNIAASCQRS